MNTPERIHAKLAALSPLVLNLRDDSEKHAGHAGAASGGGHYRLTIVSDRFDGLNAMARHRLIYAALGDMMQREIHALAIEARTPAEHAG